MSQADSQTHSERTTSNNPGWSFNPTSKEAEGHLGAELEDEAVEM
eukprot:CAMPEP_0194065356 /NCGR_PEP_ID=MMETSP0009_2-20130614/85421_1 /TAXON_ID=210454 /ORGANISM="Grammatophora oceanica, Strain CCMP 410" /LENGTH=44 /DNA_ID= /DNA_START= /DNA_END= /DNA_ORIENTATION=